MADSLLKWAKRSNGGATAMLVIVTLLLLAAATIVIVVLVARFRSRPVPPPPSVTLRLPQKATAEQLSTNILHGFNVRTSSGMFLMDDATFSSDAENAAIFSWYPTVNQKDNIKETAKDVPFQTTIVAGAMRSGEKFLGVSSSNNSLALLDSAVVVNAVQVGTEAVSIAFPGKDGTLFVTPSGLKTVPNGQTETAFKAWVTTASFAGTPKPNVITPGNPPKVLSLPPGLEASGTEVASETGPVVIFSQ